MVCTKKSSAVAAVATAASTFYGGYNGTAPSGTPSPTGSFTQPQVAAVAAPDSASSSAASAAAGAANSGIKGFNYGAFFLDQQAKVQNDFEYEFTKAQNLANTTGWNSARLYTMGKLHLLPARRCPHPTMSLAMSISRAMGVDLMTGHDPLTQEDVKANWHVQSNTAPPVTPSRLFLPPSPPRPPSSWACGCRAARRPSTTSSPR